VRGDCNVCINGELPSYSQTCVECGLSRKNYKPITKADCIRSMTDEDLAEFIGHDPMHDICPNNCDDDLDRPCKVCALDWLRQEAE
jgi:hypothetical protein